MNSAQNTGFPGDCSEAQLSQLEKFRNVLKDMELECPEQYDDAYLLRFLRARKFDLKKTLKMFDDFIAWRKKMGVDEIDSYVFTEIKEVRKFYMHGYHKTDKKGRPIYIERIGMLKLKDLFQVTNEDRLVKYYVQSYERLIKNIFPSCTAQAGHRVDQTLTILDLKDCSMGMLSKKVYNFIQLASKIGQDNYPEILGKMFIINAPMLFSGVWAVIKPWLDEKTRNKISIIGSGYKKNLAEFINPEDLPQFLGGTCNCEGDCLSRNIGPWNPKGEEIFGIAKKQDTEKKTDEKIENKETIDNNSKAVDEN